MPRLLCCTLLALVCLSCGPSPRLVQLGNARFERCYAADHNSHYTEAERRQCWARWLQDYTLGQPADKVEHAQTRARGGKARLLGPSLPSTAPTQSPVASDAGPAASACQQTCDADRDRCRKHCQPTNDSCRDTCKMEHRFCLTGC